MTIILKQLAPQLVQCLQQQAALNGRSLEAEIIAILTRVLIAASD